MRVLVIGQGGREHALAWKIAQSPSVDAIFCAPGNSGTALVGTNVPIAEDETRDLIRFCRKERIGLVVIGPEAPLVAGLADKLRHESIPVFGPSQQAAALEGSKIFCKGLLRKAKVPSADGQSFSDFKSVETYLAAHPGRCVVKADGLAAGKGVVVCDDALAASAAARRMLVDAEFGAAGQRILIEERLVGQEVSVFAITDGSTILLMDACQDHKRAFDDDAGPNTGGMGAYCPTPMVDTATMERIEREILVPIVHFLKVERRPFQGVLFAGLMLTASGPKVLEFNVRFGDPECQALMMRLRGDLAEILLATVEHRLDQVTAEWDPRPAVCVVMASDGYPAMYRRGLPISGLEETSSLEDVMVFHAGAKRDGQHVVTDGGRVLGVTALGRDLANAKERAYRGVEAIGFRGAMYRRDIADKAIRHGVDEAPNAD